MCGHAATYGRAAADAVNNESPTSKTEVPVTSPSITDVYAGSLVAYSPAKESWMTDKGYRPVGTAYITGCVHRVHKKAKKKRTGLFELRWLDSQFQSITESVNLAVVQRGISNYAAMAGSVGQLGWRELCEPGEEDGLLSSGRLDELEADMQPYVSRQDQPTSLAEVEAIQNMRFDPTKQMDAPRDLFSHPDGSHETYVLSQYRHLFEHSAVSSFLAYLPLYFWRQVLFQTNGYARMNAVPIGTAFTMEELMKFLGMLFYMGLIDKGEYANYWGNQVEDTIFGGASTSFDSIMPLRRFKLLRRSFSFRAQAPHDEQQRDAAAKIRPLLNLLKTTCAKYVAVGCDLALDEASVACRSRFGRGLIVYNPMKPTGKYHFKIYMLCCSSTWLGLNFRLHCRSTIESRLENIEDAETIGVIGEETAEVSTIRRVVLEVVRPFNYTNRILNTDNYYTSVQLLVALRLKGLYGRGTVRGNSKHYPKHVVLDKKVAVRGQPCQGVSEEHKMIAASWCDGSIVTIISNADASTATTVTRQVGGDVQEFSSPVCIKEYNSNMQGVDRLDQLRAPFSIADGHSFQKWHKKLALALIDIARCNAYLSRKMVSGVDAAGDRDLHHGFMSELVHELISGKWASAPSDSRLFYGSASASQNPVFSSPSAGSSLSLTPSPHEESPGQRACATVSSRQMFREKSKRSRECVVCRWEGRFPTVVTDFCIKHNVCLCQVVQSTTPAAYKCPETRWTCWDKFHRYYLSRMLFSDAGNLRKSSTLYKLRLESLTSPEEPRSRPVVARSIAL